MSAQHTPGPWTALLNYPTAIVPGHSIKANHGYLRPAALVPTPIGNPYSATDKANAQLIAAAPDLLAITKEVARLIQRHGSIPRPVLEDLCVRAQDIIRKAHGEVA